MIPMGATNTSDYIISWESATTALLPCGERGGSFHLGIAGGVRVCEAEKARKEHSRERIQCGQRYSGMKQ